MRILADSFGGQLSQGGYFATSLLRAWLGMSNLLVSCNENLPTELTLRKYALFDRNYRELLGAFTAMMHSAYVSSIHCRSGFLEPAA
jgi:hypothetical protein